MQIISSRTFHFKNEKENSKNEQIIVVNNPIQPQEVPEWVKDNDLYKLAVAEGSIMRVQVSKSAAKGLKSINNEPNENSIDKVPRASFVGGASAPSFDAPTGFKAS